ncbi:hypothetical protein QYF36_022772 [Acer negundo]|nr:hypothetical protein QYF36_022772 [Acer negundo]
MSHLHCNTGHLRRLDLQPRMNLNGNITIVECSICLGKVSLRRMFSTYHFERDSTGEDFDGTGEDFDGTGDNRKDFDGNCTTPATSPTVVVNHDLRKAKLLDMFVEFTETVYERDISVVD